MEPANSERRMANGEPRKASGLPTLPGRHCAEQETTMTAILQPNRHFTLLQLSPTAVTNKPNSMLSEQPSTVRERFLARHGPGADLPQRQFISKELRKALRAAEMARWEACQLKVDPPPPGFGAAGG